MIRQVLVADVVEVVVVGVLRHPPVEVCPRQNILHVYMSISSKGATQQDLP